MYIINVLMNHKYRNLFNLTICKNSTLYKIFFNQQKILSKKGSKYLNIKVILNMCLLMEYLKIDVNLGDIIILN